jgi:hypothetical protein
MLQSWDKIPKNIFTDKEREAHEKTPAFKPVLFL